MTADWTESEHLSRYTAISMTMPVSSNAWVGKYPLLWATLSLLIVVFCSCIYRAFSHTKNITKSTNGKLLSPLQGREISVSRSFQVTEDDLRTLLVFLGGPDEDGVPWEHIIHKQNEHIIYYAKRRDPKDGGATQYMSTTVFENCAPELLRDFYMDNDYRLEWDNTVLTHTQLDICLGTGTEVGCTLKKFPFMMKREYVLAWRIWDVEDQSFYCVIKSCEHHHAPKLPSHKRVEPYFSGWCIRKVPGRLASEITMFYQEELGMQRELAKMAFSQGIWNYVKKMELNLRKYPAKHKDLKASPNAVAYAHQISKSKFLTLVNHSDQISIPLKFRDSSVTSKIHGKRVKFIGKSLLLLGGALFLSRSSTKLGAKIAAALIASKILNSSSLKIPTGNSKYSNKFSLK